jgi:hypothetical protein
VKKRDRSRADRIRDDRRQFRANPVQLLEQGQGASEQPAAAGDAGGCHERESPHAFGLGARQLRRDQAAKRVADEVDRSELDRVEETAEPGSELAGAEARETRQLDEVKPVMLGEPLGEHRPPAPGAGKPVHDDDVRSCSRDAVACRPPVELDMPLLHVVILHHEVSRFGVDLIAKGIPPLT